MAGTARDNFVNLGVGGHHGNGSGDLGIGEQGQVMIFFTVNTTGGSITVLLTSCLTGLESAV